MGYKFRIFKDCANDFTLITIESKQVIVTILVQYKTSITKHNHMLYDGLSCLSIISKKVDGILNNITNTYFLTLWILLRSLAISQSGIFHKHKYVQIMPFTLPIVEK